MDNKNPGCLDQIKRLFGLSGKKTGEKVKVQEGEDEEQKVEDTFPYRLRDDFLSDAERSFYLVVKGMMADIFTICPKVSLSDVFYVIRPNENGGAFNRINRKHVDFLVCETKTLKPVFAIELDDSSHQRPDRVERDEFVDKVFDAASLPLLHIPARANYNVQELGVLFRQVLQKEKPIESPKPIPETGQAPCCPKCGVQMVLRTAQRGSNAGQKFYGCPNYPRCKEVAAFQ